MKLLLNVLIIFIAFHSITNALNNGLGLTPQMGYNTWYDLQCSLSEDLVRSTADTLIKLGFDTLGYKYINLDDCWAKGRYQNGSVYAEVPRFSSPSLKPLADYIHSLNLLFGVYTDRGIETCAGRPGSNGFEISDANTYASWGVDYVKEDSCHAAQDHTTEYENYAAMRDALNATDRPIFFSLCGWNAWYSTVGASLANSWRIGPDDTNWEGVLANIDINVKLSGNAGPGGWNDPCLLLAEDMNGKQRVTELQSRAQFSMWSIMKSPLIISANIRNMSAMNIATYSNKAVIAVNQDPLGHQGTRIFGGDLTNQYGNRDANGVNIWSTNLMDGAKAFVFLNVNNITQDIACDAKCFVASGFPDDGLQVMVFDLWDDNRNLGQRSTLETCVVKNVMANGGVEMYKFVPMYETML
eukprot:274902_1